jgi:hypothetical protein
MRIDESPLPPADATPSGFTSGRPTATPAATPDAAWKYVTIVFAVENRSDSPRLVGIAGSSPTDTNLNGATLTTRDGQRYKALRSASSFGIRTATARSLTSYPVLLRLPPGFRAAAESFGALSLEAPTQNSITFKLPATLTDYGTLTIPPLTGLGPKTGDDDISKRLRSVLGGFAPADLGGLTAGAQSVAFPSTAQAASLPAVGASVSVPGSVSVTLVSADEADPTDYQARNSGWKQLTISLRYRNDDPKQAHAFAVSAWLFGQDGVVYTGDVPALGNFSRAVAAPDVTAVAVWDGRSAGADQIAAGQEQEPRRAVFTVPSELHTAVLVLGGQVEAAYALAGIGGQP